eukprot:ANDGO_01187.mRNA.1 hypothetical protein
MEPPRTVRPDSVHVYEGLNKKRFPYADDSVLLGRVRKDWGRTDPVSSLPPKPENLAYPRSLLIRSELPNGMLSYHVLPVWLMMMPTFLKQLPLISAIWTGFMFLTMRFQDRANSKVNIAEQTLQVAALSLFALATVLALYVKAQFDGLMRFRSVEFMDGADSLRRALMTVLIENRNTLRLLKLSWFLGITCMFASMILFMWNRLVKLGDGETDNNGLAAWIALTAFSSAIWIAMLASASRLINKGTYILSLDRNVLLHH